jgi:hypothetical protein
MNKKYWIYKWVGAELRIVYCDKAEATESAERLRKMINLVDRIRK